MRSFEVPGNATLNTFEQTFKRLFWISLRQQLQQQQQRQHTSAAAVATAAAATSTWKLWGLSWQQLMQHRDQQQQQQQQLKNHFLAFHGLTLSPKSTFQLNFNPDCLMMLLLGWTIFSSLTSFFIFHSFFGWPRSQIVISLSPTHPLSPFH